MADEDDARFGTLLRELIDRLDGALEEAYRADGLDFRPRYTPIVRLLAAHGPLSIRAIATRVGVSHSAISQTIAQMRARGLVETTPGVDARARIVAATPALTALMPRLARHWQAATIATAALDEEVGGLVAAVALANEALVQRPYADRLRDALSID